MKRLFSILLALLMLASVIPLTAMAIEANIISHPTLEDPTFEVSSPEEVEKYEWFITSIEEIAITDENASNVCTNCEGNYNSSYDEENDLWTGAKVCDAENGYEMFYFTVALKEGERLYIDAGPEVSTVNIFDYDNTAGFSPSFSMVGNVQVFTADYEGNYTISAITPSLDSKISAFMLNVTEDELSETETSATLSEIKFGCLYQCVATYIDGTTLTSSTLPAYPYSIEEPTADNPTFEVRFEEEASFRWYEVDENGNATALEDENTKTLSSIELGKSYYCEASFPYGMNIESDIFSIYPEIINQPTVLEPSFEVTCEEDASFQWYEATEKYLAIDDTMTEFNYGTYDKETEQWLGNAGDHYEYEDYQEYQIELFNIKLKAGQNVKITITNPAAVSPADPDLRFNGSETDSNYLEYDENGVTYFTVEHDDLYYVYQYAIYPETTTFKFELLDYDLTEIEGETEKTLSKMEYGKKYICIASYSDETELTSKAFDASAEIISQPSAEKPTVEVTFEDNASFQWHEATEKFIVIDSSMVSYIYGSYNEETGQWMGDSWESGIYGDYTEYGMEYFDIHLKKGDTIKITLSDPALVSNENEFRFSPYNGNNYYIEPEEDGTYIFTAPYTDIYFLYNYVTDPSVTVKAEKLAYDLTEIEGETEKTLSEYTSGTLYAATATYTDGTVLTSDVFQMVPAITKQPTVEDMSIEVNIEEEGMEYQWHEIITGEFEVTDKLASSAYLEGDSEGEPSYFDEENGYWVPSLYGTYDDNEGNTYYEFDIFEIYLKAGESIAITPSGEIKDNYYDFLCENDPEEYEAEIIDGVYYFTAAVEQSYYFYTDSYERDITFTAVFTGRSIGDAIKGANGKEFAPLKAGEYLCIVTYADGAELVSDSVIIDENNVDRLGDINDDGDVDQYDYILAKRIHFENYTPKSDEAIRGDVDKDGDNDQYDYIFIKRHYFGNYVIK